MNTPYEQPQAKLGGHLPPPSQLPKGGRIRSHFSSGWGWGQHRCCRQSGQGVCVLFVHIQAEEPGSANAVLLMMGGGLSRARAVPGTQALLSPLPTLCGAAGAASTPARNTSPPHQGRSRAQLLPGWIRQGRFFPCPLCCCVPLGLYESGRGNGQRDFELRKC